MAIVKNTQADRLMKDAVVLDLGDLKRQAGEILARARTEAAAVLERANAEAQQRIEGSTGKGYEDGYRKGVEEGRETGRAQAHEQALLEFRERFEALDANWTAAVDRWDEQRRAMLLDAEADVLTFAFDLAKKITHRTVAGDASVAIDQVRATLALLSRPTAVTIRVHDDDFDAIDEVMPCVRDRLATCEHVELVRDASVGRGGCVVKTAGGEIDASIDGQLDRIAETLLPRDARTARREDDPRTRESS